MKKNFKYYAAVWTILFVLFQLVVFLMRPFLPGFFVRYDARFWISWCCIVIAFIGNLICAYIVFDRNSVSQTFYHLPLITVSRGALIAVLILGCAFMLIPDFPAWNAAIVCGLLLAFNAIAVVKAGWAATAVADIDRKTAAQTSFIKTLTADAEELSARTKSGDVRAACQKVYEAARYSDPVSSEALSAEETRIAVGMRDLAAAVAADDGENAAEIAEELTVLIRDRNRKCKTLK